jgi:hypothetical protein
MIDKASGFLPEAFFYPAFCSAKRVFILFTKAACSWADGDGNPAFQVRQNGWR